MVLEIFSYKRTMVYYLLLWVIWIL